MFLVSTGAYLIASIMLGVDSNPQNVNGKWKGENSPVKLIIFWGRHSTLAAVSRSYSKRKEGLKLKPIQFIITTLLPPHPSQSSGRRWACKADPINISSHFFPPHLLELSLHPELFKSSSVFDSKHSLRVPGRFLGERIPKLYLVVRERPRSRKVGRAS